MRSDETIPIPTVEDMIKRDEWIRVELDNIGGPTFNIIVSLK